MSKTKPVTPSRRVGVELEFGHLDFQTAASIIGEWLAVEPEPVSDYELLFHVPRYGGAFRLEIDWELLKTLARENEAEPEPLRSSAVELLAEFGERWVPLELVTPPLAVADLGLLNAPLSALADAGAIGTQASLLAAYGTHLNPEVDPLTVENILPQLQAFAVLQHWIVATDEIDLTRRISQYARLFDRGYEALLLQPNYAPTLAQLVDDYLAYNPSRNRALDMLPLFAELDDARVRRTVEDDRVKARPTFHYRLGDCRIGEPGWTIERPWYSWQCVERLAADAPRLAALCQARIEFLGRAPILASDKSWILECQNVIDALAIGVTGPARRLAPGRLAAMAGVWLAGGQPVWLAPGNEPSIFDELDGVVVTGGSDIDPTAYGSSDKPWSPPDVERDLFELAVIERIDAGRRPALGICRGAQLLNVKRGGNLHGDIVALRRWTRNYKTLLPKRPVAVACGSDLAAVLGVEGRAFNASKPHEAAQLFPDQPPDNGAALKINALHHQAVNALGGGLRVVAVDEDGITQAIEDTSSAFFIGVQWHPEYLLWAPPHFRLFRALVAAALDSRSKVSPQADGS